MRKYLISFSEKAAIHEGGNRFTYEAYIYINVYIEFPVLQYIIQKLFTVTH